MNLLVLPLRMGDVYSGLRDDMPAFNNCQRFDNRATISGHYFRMAAPRKFVTIAGKRITVSNLERILYPGEKFTKAKVIEYYVQISRHLLPHLKQRPVTLKRYPEGVFGEAFYEKDAPAFTPAWVKTAPVPRRETRSCCADAARSSTGARPRFIRQGLRIEGLAGCFINMKLTST